MAITYIARSGYASGSPLKMTVPATAQAGDLLLAACGDGNGISSSAITLPGGWGHVQGSPMNDFGASPHRYVLCYKIATSDDVSATFTWGNTTGTNSHGRILVYRSDSGQFGDEPVVVTDTDHNTGTNGTISANLPAANGGDDSNVYCAFFELGWAVGVTINEPSGSPAWVSRWFQDTTGQIGFLWRDSGKSGAADWTQVAAVGGPGVISFTIQTRQAASGTTDDAIASGGTPLALVAAIEGYPYAITNWHDKQAVEVAWDGLGFDSGVIGGMTIQGEYSQEIRPLDPQMDFGTIALRILPDSDDTLGEDVWSSQRSSGQLTVLSSSMDPDDTTMSVIPPDSAWTGTNRAYVGTEAVTYTAPFSGSSITITARGESQPFQNDAGNGFARSHIVTQNSGAATYRPYVTDWKRVWIGSHIGVWLHKADGDDLNTRANARLLFAGTIADVQDAEDGSLTIVATDIREQIGERLLLADQWSAAPAEEVYVGSNEKITVFANALSTYTDGVTTTVTEGTATVEEIIEEINSDLNASATGWELRCGVNAGGYFFVEGTSQTATSTANDLHTLTVTITPGLADILGVSEGKKTPNDPGFDRYVLNEWANGTQPTIKLVGNEPVAYATPRLAFGATLNVEDASGTFVSQGDLMPELIKVLFGTDAGGEDWGFLHYEGHGFLVRKESATQLTVMWEDRLVYPLLSDNDEPLGSTTVRRGQQVPRFRQVILIEENLGEWLPRLIASTGASGYNHATYDAYDRQLGCAIPWSLLGDTFLESCRDLAEVGDSRVTVFLDRPTRVRDLLLPELALRDAHLIFRDGLVLKRATADVVTADHTLTDANLVGTPDDYTQARPIVNWSRSLIVNSIKVEFNRTTEDKYLGVIELQNSTSIAEHGTSNPVTIKARNNAYRGANSDITGIYHALEALGADILAVYDEPLRVVSMPVDGISISTMAPGDSVSLSSSFIRDPQTGQRGSTGLLGYILRTSFDFNAMGGDIDILLTGAEEARAAPLSPAAKVDETFTSGLFTAGYDNTNDIIRLKANEFSGASEADDVTHFAAGDKIRVIEKSPATAGSPQAWAVTADSVDTVNGEITLSAALTGFDTSKEYYVISDDYATAVTAQQADSYIADDADDLVLDTVRSRQWRAPPSFDYGIVDVSDTIGSIDDLFEIPPTDGSWWSEGEPLSPVQINWLSKSANHLAYRRQALATAWYFTTGGKTTTSSTYEALATPFPVYVGQGVNKRMTLTVGMYAGTSAGTATFRVSSWNQAPDGPTDFVNVDYLDQQVRQIEFTTTSTGENIATQTIALNVNADGITWITIEGKTTSGTATLYGFSTWSLAVTP